MVKEDVIEVDWVVIDLLGRWKYSVKIDWMDMKVIAELKWKMRMFKIRIIVWDKVKLELNQYDPTKWRITFRYWWKKSASIDEKNKS